MKRRDFLKAPAIGVLLPGAVPLGLLNPHDAEGVQAAPSTERPVIRQRMHPDFITFVDGIEYFYLGNGDIQGAIQFSPRDPQTTFVGFTLMDPEHFCRKWSTFLYHPERGLSNSKLGVSIGTGDSGEENRTGMYHGVIGYAPLPETFVGVRWKYPDGIPVVSLTWRGGECEIEEEFFVPSEGAILFRRVNVRNTSDREVEVKLGLSLYANFGLFDRISTNERDRRAEASGFPNMKLLALNKNVSVAGRYDVRIDLGKIAPHGSGQGTYVYAINGGEKILQTKNAATLWKETAVYWNLRSDFRSGNATADHLFHVSRSGLKSVIARSGKMDAGTWMYNMEWLGDHILAMEALLQTGWASEARLLLEKNLKHSIWEDGRTIESGRWFGYDYTEINQNGILLYGVWKYLCWTGDVALVKRYWDKIRLCGDFPLRDVFLDPATHMVRNKREFWERSDTHGIENGYELGYQFWVSFGLAKGALVASMIGDSATGRRWSQASEAMSAAMLEDPKFRLIEDGHFIKRRTIDGRWQRYLRPPDRGRLPPGSPIATEANPSTEPDTTTVLPILYEMIDPRSDLARKTLAWVEQLWNQQWATGGYPRYNVTGEDNPPAPWPIASMLVARAYAAAGDDSKVWRVLDWLHTIHGGASGSWFERYGPSITPPMPPVGVVGWIWYEIIGLWMHHVAGIRPEIDVLVVKPRLLSGLNDVSATALVRGTRIDLEVHRTSGISKATVDGKEFPMENGSLRITYVKKKERTVRIELA